MTRIIGLDIGKHGKAVGWLIDELHRPLSAYYQAHQKDYFTIYPTNDGIDFLLKLEPDGIVMEPTGSWYSSIWGRVGKVYGIPVYWVGHADLHGQRKHFDFKNKYDQIDALVLASCYFDDSWVNRFGEKHWLKSYRSEVLEPVRELFWEYRQLLKLRTVLVQQLKQRCAYEFPEIAGDDWHQSETKGTTPIIRWLAGKSKTGKKSKKYPKSVAVRLGIDLTDYTENHANLTITVELALFEIEQMLTRLLDRPEFAPYIEVFKSYGIGPGVCACLLLRTYPLERFLNNGQVVIDMIEHPDGRITKQHKSLRWFQAFLGFTRYHAQSGDEDDIKFGGSKVCRALLFQSFKPRLTRGHTEKTAHFRWEGDKADLYVEKYLNLRNGGVTGHDAVIRCLFMITRHIFYDLVKAIL